MRVPFENEHLPSVFRLSSNVPVEQRAPSSVSMLRHDLSRPSHQDDQFSASSDVLLVALLSFLNIRCPWISQRLSFDVERQEPPAGRYSHGEIPQGSQGSSLRLARVWEFSARLKATLGHGALCSPAGEIVQVEVQRACGVPAADIFRPPCFYHLSSRLGFLVVLDARRTVETARFVSAL